MTRATLETYLNRWGLRALAIAAAILILFWLVVFAAGYYVVEYASPPWNEASVPAPRPYQ